MKAPSARHRTLPVLEGASLRLGEERVPLRSAAIHYWRLARDSWKPALEQCAALGFQVVETYAPWSVHETARGEFDFGDVDPQKDLGAFIDLAGELSLRVFVRPGPHINAEMTYFGIPERIVNDPECQAKSPRGNPVILYFPPRMFPVPSYASEAYLEEVAAWMQAVGNVVAPRIWPAGPVVLLQVDNEAGFYFRNGPFCQDYHDDAVGLWHSFLDERHGGLEAVAKAHGESYAGWSEATPPVRFEGATPGSLTRQLDWAAFHESLLAGSVGRIRKLMERAGMRAPMVHNVSLGDGGLPISVPAFDQEVDLVGLDYYHAEREQRTVKRRTLYLAGTVETPYSPELGVGAPPWFTPLSHRDSLTTALSACAYGLRGFNLYMTVDRDRWYGAPIDAKGRARPEAADWRRLLDALTRTRFETLTRKAPVALMWPREYQRLTRATHSLGAASPSNLEAIGGSPTDGCRPDDFGLDVAVQHAWWETLETMADALTAANVPYVYVDSDAPLARFSERAVVFAPTFAMASSARWQRLQTLIREGVHVVYGPSQPRVDETLRPATFAALDRGPTRIDREMAHALVHDWIDRFDLERPYPALPPVDTCVHRQGDEDVVLFVINAGEATTAEIVLPRPTSVEDAISGERFEGEKALSVPMAEHHVRMLLIDHKTPRARAGR